MKRIWVLFSIVLANGVAAQDTLHIGMNLSGVAYWAEPMFANHMKHASGWVTQNDHWVEGGQNPWDSGVRDSLAMDENGYPLSLPAAVQGTEVPQVVGCLMNRALSAPYYPSGTYVCRYDGVGVLDFMFDAAEVGSTPGRIVLNVTPSDAGIFLVIRSSTLGNHVRNVRIFPPGVDENDPPTFAANFATSLAPFPVLRFMDWGSTNFSPLTSWGSRPLPDYYSYADAPGSVPIEVMIRLCNEMNVDPWFCVPHAADSVYIQRFAELARDSLEADKRVYIEYSNEVWNGMFGQYVWVENNGPAELSHPGKYAHFAGQVFRIWRRVFGADSLRITRVLAGQLANSWHIQEGLSYLGSNGCDQISIAAYFGLFDEYYDSLRATGAASTPEQVLEYCHQIIESQVRPNWQQHINLAESNGLELNAYEGGQHLILEIPGVVEPYMQALWDAQEHPEMYHVYRRLLHVLKSSGSPLLMAFSHVGGQESVWGSWGHLSYLDQPLAEAQKYRALVDYQTAQHWPVVNNLTAYRVGGQLRLRWSALPGATRYVVFTRDNLDPGIWQEIGSTTSNSFLTSYEDEQRLYYVTVEF